MDLSQRQRIGPYVILAPLGAYASYLEPARVRASWSMWQWDTDLVDRLLQGFSKALALVDRPGDASRGCGVNMWIARHCLSWMAKRSGRNTPGVCVM
jgi:hypothetical protein